MPYSFLPIPKGFQRLDPFPLDSTFVFETLQDLTDYALNLNDTAYIGQICSVISEESLYLIKPDRTLKKINDDSSFFAFISSTSSAWVYQGTDLKQLSSNWENTFTDFNSQSSNNISVYTTVNSNSSNWDYQGTDLKQLSSNWESTFTTVNSNSAIVWNYQGTDLKQLSSNWENTFTDFNSQSSNNISVYTTVNSNSGNWDYQGTDLKQLSSNWENTFTDFNSQSSNNISVYTTVNSNSSNWDYQGTDLKQLSSNWESIFTDFNSQSSNNISVYTDVSNTSGNWDDVYSIYNTNSSTYSTYEYVNSGFLPLSGGIVTGSLEVGSGSSTLYVDNQFVGINTETPNEELTVVGDVSATGQLYADGYNKSNWDDVYSIYNTNSSTYSTYEYVNSGFLPLSGGIVTGSLEVGSGSSTLYVDNQFVGINTETPNEELTVVGDVSATGQLYADGYNKSNWDDVYSTVKTNSASFLSTSSDIQEFFDDFITIGSSSTLPNALLKQINSGGSIFVVAENGKQGVLTVGTNNLMISNQRGSATSNETIHFGQGDEYRLIFSARRGSNSFNNSLSGRFDMGFHDMLGTNSIVPDDGCYFSSENGETWKTCTKTHSQSLIVNDTGIPCDENWRVFEINVNSDGSIVNFYIDNVLVSTHTQSIPNSPGSHTAIGYRAYRYSNDPVNLELRIDWQKIIIKRQSNLW